MTYRLLLYYLSSVLPQRIEDTNDYDQMFKSHEEENFGRYGY